MINRYRAKVDTALWYKGMEFEGEKESALLVERLFHSADHKVIVGETFIKNQPGLFEPIPEEEPKPNFVMPVEVGDMFTHNQSGKLYKATSVNFYEGGMKVTIKPVAQEK